MKKLFYGVLFGALVVIGCSSGSPMVGNWELQLDEKIMKEMPAGTTKPSVTVEFKGDGTWVGKMSGLGKDSTAEGTYKLDGKSLSMTTTKEDGKDKADGKTETATLADDMKSFDLPGSQGMGKMVKK